jgi:hypothetical protein
MPQFDPVSDPVYGRIYDKGGAVYNVKHKDFAGGAKGDGVTDDTAAVLAAVAAANSFQVLTDSQTASSGQGGIVYFPPGVYRVLSTINVSSGVTLRGAGMHTSQVVLALNSATSGIVWNQGSETVFYTGGGLVDIDISSSYQVQDAVVLRTQANFHISRARIRGANRYNLRIERAVHLVAVNLFSETAGTSTLFIGPVEEASASYSTTCHFFGCYFQNAQDGPAADVSGYGMTFEGCVFESAGVRTAAGGYGIVGRWGTFTLVNPYFESNANSDMRFGTEAPSGSQLTTVTIINPVLTPPVAAKVSGAAYARFERGVVTLLGGNYGPTPAYPISFSSIMTRVFMMVENMPVEPKVDAPRTLDTLPGFIWYADPATGDNIVTGLSGYRIGDGTLIRKHLSVLDSDWQPNGGAAIAHSASVSRNVTVTGAQFGDTVVVSFNHQNGGLGGGVILFGSVSAANTVTATLLNVSGGSLTFGNGKLRVDVWKH